MFLVVGSSNLEDHLPFLSWLGVKRTEKKLISLQTKKDSFMQRLIDQLRHLKVENNTNNNNKKNTMIELVMQHQETDPNTTPINLLEPLCCGCRYLFYNYGMGLFSFAQSYTDTHVLGKARNEIDSHVDKNHLVDESDVANLPYLRCIVNETL